MYKLPRLRDLRRQRVLSQRELAALAHAQRMASVHVESGCPVPLSTARKIAEALTVDPSELVKTPAT